MLLKDKRVVLVGGSSGIGLATARLAKSEGAAVTIAARSAQRLQAAADADGLPGIEADVTSAEDIARQILAFMTIGFATGSIAYLDGGGTIA